MKLVADFYHHFHQFSAISRLPSSMGEESLNSYKELIGETSGHGYRYLETCNTRDRYWEVNPYQGCLIFQQYRTILAFFFFIVVPLSIEQYFCYVHDKNRFINDK